ncbi:MAG: SDR family NAD(P)-dependent oxidoreductase [Aggregatilineales bacterium]
MHSYMMITGAAGGLGKAFAAECASRGWNLFLTDLAEDSLRPLATGMERLYGVEVRIRPCDLTDPAARAALWEDVARQGVCFHGLINMAGIEHEGSFVERSVEELLGIVRLNVEAAVEMTRRVVQFRDLERRLLIVNASSLAGYFAIPMKAVYAASKRFVLDFSKALHEELKPGGVTVMALCPAGLPTAPRCIRGIEAQGFVGRLMALNVGDVAAMTIEHALAGRAVYVPGIFSQFILMVGNLLPERVVAAVLNRRWRDRGQPVRHTLSIPVSSTSEVMTSK